MHLGLASALTRQAMSYLTFSSDFLCTIAGAALEHTKLMPRSLR